MGTGKKIGVVAVIVAVLFMICGIILITQMPEIRPEVYELMYTDQELAMQMMEEDLNNGSTLFIIANKCSDFIALAGIILSIVSLVKMVKGKEKGIIIPILVLIFIIVFYFVIGFSGIDMNAMMDSAMNTLQ